MLAACTAHGATTGGGAPGARVEGSGWWVQASEGGGSACLSLWRAAVVELTTGASLPAQTVCVHTPLGAPAVLSTEVVPGSRDAIVTLGWVPAATERLVVRSASSPDGGVEPLQPLGPRVGRFFAFATHGAPLSVSAVGAALPPTDVLAHRVHRCPGPDPLVVTDVAQCAARPRHP